MSGIEIKPDVKNMIDEIMDENIGLKRRVEFLESLREEDQQAFKRAEERRIEDEQIIIQQAENLGKANDSLEALRMDNSNLRAGIKAREAELTMVRGELHQYKNNQAIANMQKELQLKQQKIVDLEAANRTMGECLNQLQEIATRFGMGE